ncbi:MAG: hypothetical protein A2Y62_09455 [Candidatus Fischerbacteria bacterium RBG_13_37_8]|uniref:Uncharacterized protein n=1 Tax=Candidatus Fischerbacteria bacterium RBG_13_37_8 TaxID=1817863 RepID=A0A1F5VUZ4_9BACT|nr:MAG: hypothetical protein A2Y62_09455 [Candidatus Fischerbacteria bacterium RBG_13_37_8]
MQDPSQISLQLLTRYVKTKDLNLFAVSPQIFFFAEYDVSFRGIDIRERMEVAIRVKDAIRDEAMNMRMPGEEITEGLNREDETRSKRFMREDGAK